MIDRIASEIAPGLDKISVRISRLKLNKISILNTVAEEFDTYVFTLHMRTKKRSSTAPRQVAHFFLLLLPNYNMEKAGKVVGDVDRTTVSYSASTVVKDYDSNRQYRERIDAICQRLGISNSTLLIHLNRFRKN